jgi:hypothetical protein
MSHLHLPALFVALSWGAAAHAQSSYINPVDGKTYTTPGEFRTYQPASPKDQSKQRVKNEGIVLLTGEQDLVARATVEDVAAFITQAAARARIVLARHVGTAAVMVQFNCQPKLCRVQIAGDGKPSKILLQALHDSLASMQALRTSGEVIFQLSLRVDA